MENKCLTCKHRNKCPLYHEMIRKNSGAKIYTCRDYRGENEDNE